MSTLKDIDPNFSYGKITSAIVNYIIARDSGLCLCCGGAGAHIHHVIFRSHGGGNAPNNLMSVCVRCHGKIHGYEMPNSSPPFVERVRKQIKVNEERLRRRFA